jgi:hypothetical protein
MAPHTARAQGATNVQIPNIPNVDSIVQSALSNGGAQGGMLIAQVFSDTGVQRAIHHNGGTREAVRQAVHDYTHTFDRGSSSDHAAATQKFIAAIKQATGRDFSSQVGPQGQLANAHTHTPRIDVHVPGVNVHVGPDDIPAPPEPPAPPAPPVPFSQSLSDSLKRLVDRARHDPGVTTLPSLDAFTAGSRTVAGVVNGSVATVGGPLTIDGTVNGDAAAVAGDVILTPNGVVNGNVTAVGGEVRENGGRINGEIRSTGGKIGPVSKIAAVTPHHARNEFRMSLAFLAVMLIGGVGVLTFASDPLDAAAQAVSEQFTRALGYGVVGALAVLPVLVVMVIAICLTIVGIIFSPVVVLLYTLVVLGIILVGFYAVAETTGRAIYRRRSGDPLSERGAKLRGLVTGIAIYGGLWVVAAIFGGLPGLGVVLHVIASAVTVIVILVGCGAVLVSRRDARAAIGGRKSVPYSVVPDLPWQTPTPVGGVAAARRPTPPPGGSGPVS